MPAFARMRETEAQKNHRGYPKLKTEQISVLDVKPHVLDLVQNLLLQLASCAISHLQRFI